MSDEDQVGTFTPPRAVIPSRAAQPAAPQSVPAFLENPSPGTERDPTKRTRSGTPERSRPKKAKAKRERLPAAEIRRINKRRAKNVKKAKKRGKTKIQIVRRAVRDSGRAATSPKNPNRPLERKNQMLAMLHMARTLQKGELKFFTEAAEKMQGMSRTGRRHVLSALQQVYG